MPRFVQYNLTFLILSIIIITHKHRIRHNYVAYGIGMGGGGHLDVHITQRGGPRDFVCERSKHTTLILSFEL